MHFRTNFPLENLPEREKKCPVFKIAVQQWEDELGYLGHLLDLQCVQFSRLLPLTRV